MAEQSTQEVSATLREPKIDSPEIFGEHNVGITTFLTAGKPFKGIAKYRISDFIVNEVTPNKQVLFPFENEILSESQPKEQKTVSDPIPENTQEAEKKGEYELSTETEEQAKKLFGKDKAEKLIQFYYDLQAGLKATPGEFSILVDCPEVKEERTKIHTFVRENLHHMDSSTEGDNKIKSIKIFFTKNRAKRGRTEAKIFHAVLFKNGLDSFSAIANIGKYLRVQPKSIGTAGIKDKRGITTQLISLNAVNQTAEQLAKRFQSAKWYNMKVQQVREAGSNGQLRIGDLYGNRFSLAIRLIDFNEQNIIDACEDLKVNGFINYYGMQRFGTNSSVHTHEIGLQIIKKQWEKAFDAIIGQETNDNSVNAAKRAFIADKTTLKTAMRDIPNKYKIERTVMQGYERAGMKGNFLQALCFLPRNSRNLYCHAYQSYLWNKLASYRVQTFGNKVVNGDIVAKRRDAFLVDVEGEEEINEVEGETEDQGDVQEAGEKAYKGVNDVDVEIVNDQNASKYTIHDVLVPIFGGKLKLPEGFNLSEPLEKLLEQDGLSQANFISLQKEFCVEGGYRLLTSQAEDFKYTLNKYNEKNQEILTPYYNEKEDFNDENGKLTALCLKFTLAKGAYATMLIRELTKLPSDFETQMTLNKEYQSM